MSQIFIISAIYPPEPQVSSRMSHDLANHLAEQGYRVTVLCPQPSRPANADYSQYSKEGVELISTEGDVRVVRLPSFASPESRLLPRLWESFCFGRYAIRYLVRLSIRPDVIYMNAWPVASQIMIAHYAKQHSIPLVTQVMDIYPEALTGKLPSLIRSFVDWPFKKLDTRVATAASAVIVISESMKNFYNSSRGIPYEKIFNIPTWQDDSIFNSNPSRSACCKIYGIPEQIFTFMYLGNIGPVAGVDFLIRSFAEAALPDAQLVIAGDGTAKAGCQELVKQLKLGNVYFVSDPDVTNVPLLQAMADVCMLPMKRGTRNSSIPSKLPAYMFSAKPVIATVDPESDTASSVIKAECGWVGNAEDTSWLANTMQAVAAMQPEQLKAVGMRGYQYGVKFFSKVSGVNSLAKVVSNLVSHL